MIRKLVGVILLFFAAILGTAPARAVPMDSALIVSNTSGGPDTFHGDFLLSWSNLANQSANNIISGTWAGGTWEIVTTTFLNPQDSDVGVAFTLRTYWNDGWIPGGLGTLSYLGYGANFTGVLFSVPYNHPPLVAQDYGALGLQYFLFGGDPFLDATIGADGTSGTVRLVWNVTRISAVPESGASWLLLGFSFALIAGLRRFCPIVRVGIFQTTKRFRESG